MCDLKKQDPQEALKSPQFSHSLVCLSKIELLINLKNNSDTVITDT